MIPDYQEKQLYKLLVALLFALSAYNSVSVEVAIFSSGMALWLVVYYTLARLKPRSKLRKFLSEGIKNV
jgi:hypothetical protein